VKFRFGSPKPVRYSKFVAFLAFVISANDCTSNFTWNIPRGIVKDGESFDSAIDLCALCDSRAMFQVRSLVGVCTTHRARTHRRNELSFSRVESERYVLTWTAAVTGEQFAKIYP
jgi:hypothetical protein